MLNQFQFCEENGVPFCAVIGESELQQGVVTLRDMTTRKEVRVFSGVYMTDLFYLLDQIFVLYENRKKEKKIPHQFFFPAFEAVIII